MRTKSYAIIMLVIVLVVLIASPVLGGNDSRKGTAGAMELLIPVGARASAMSGAMTAGVSGAEAIFWNPAGVSRAEGVELLFSNMSYIADINVNYFAIAAGMGETGTIAASVKTLNFGDINITTTDLPEGTGGVYSPSYITFGLTYSNRFTDRIFGGFTVKYISEKVLRTSASGVAMDLGIQYLSSSGIKLGVALKNLGPQMQFDGPDLEYFASLSSQDPGSRTRALRLTSSGFELPSTLELGLGYDLALGKDNVIAFGGSFQNSNFGSDEFRVGVEYCWNKILYLRGGMMQQQNQADNIYGPTFGVGVNIPVSGNSAITLDYGYRKTDFFDGSQWLAIKLTI
jgi:hypothetical protein